MYNGGRADLCTPIFMARNADVIRVCVVFMTQHTLIYLSRSWKLQWPAWMCCSTVACDDLPATVRRKAMRTGRSSPASASPRIYKSADLHRDKINIQQHFRHTQHFTTALSIDIMSHDKQFTLYSHNLSPNGWCVLLVSLRIVSNVC